MDVIGSLGRLRRPTATEFNINIDSAKCGIRLRARGTRLSTFLQM